MLLVVSLISTKGTCDAQFLQNYADIYIADAMAPFRKELVQLVENFDFDGIQKLMFELDC